MWWDGATKAVLHSDSALIFSPHKSSGRILVAADVPWLWHPRFLQQSAIFAFLPHSRKNPRSHSLSTKCFLWQLQPFFFKALTFQIYENDPLTTEITDSLQLKAIYLQTEPSGKKSAFITQQRRNKRSWLCKSEGPSDIIHIYFLITNKYFFEN